MVAIRASREKGRELALLTLCHLESYTPDQWPAAVEVLWANPPGADESPLPGLLEEEPVREFARALLAHADPALDETLQAASQRWRIRRMDAVDRNVLRLCAIELAHFPDTPTAVILAEGVRLAARYGSERSAPFVNGVADTLARAVRAERASGSEGDRP